MRGREREGGGREEREGEGGGGRKREINDRYHRKDIRTLYELAYLVYSVICCCVNAFTSISYLSFQRWSI